MKRKAIFFLFNLLPAYVQNKLIVRRRAFLNYLNFNKTLDAFSHFSFIQVGANDGVSFDGLFEYIHQNKNIKTGIVIEPISEYFLELQQNYSEIPTIKCLNFALHPNLDEVSLYKVKSSALNELPEWSKGIASLLENHHAKSGIPKNQMVIEKVKALSLRDVFEHYSDSQSDYNLLQIDTEGFDAEIVKMIDFSSMNFDIIKFERVNLEGEEYKSIETLLKAHKYFLIEQPEDTIAIRQGIKIFLK